MHLRTLLYFVAFPLCIYAMDALDFNRLLKKGRILQARILYLLIALGLSYLFVNFFMDFFTSTIFQF